MSICLCNLSADSVLELCAQTKRELEPASPDPSHFVADSVVARECLGELTDHLPHPMELLVDKARKRRVSAEIACHVWTAPLPAGSFYALEEGVYVTSPELTLLQQASQLHQAMLCQMLGRYVGTWTPAKEDPNGQAGRAPLTTLESLHTYLRGMVGVGGANNLRLAMAYTCEGAASAPETSLQLALCLPWELNGLGIPLPIMNYEIALSTASRKLYPHESIRIDLCWPREGFGLEYQGEGHGKHLGDDYARWFAAREEGFELWFVAKDQLDDADQMAYIGREVAKRIGAYPNDWSWPPTGDLQDLLDILAGRRHARPLGRAELHRRRAEVRALRRASR